MATGRDFTSDNASGAAPAVIEAIARASDGTALAYGSDPYTVQLQKRVSQVFETDCFVFPVFTGTAANALALSCLSPPFGAVFCHRMAHIYTSECGAPEFYTGGAKLVGMESKEGRIAPDTLRAAMADLGRGIPHHFQPAALSLTQATECGTLYTPDDVRILSGIAREHDLKVHMDGARFANAVSALGISPKEASWGAGVDVLSLGLTKNGAIAAEAVVFFDERIAREAQYRQKRAGQVASKMRFLSAQFLAMFEDGLWLRLARDANAMAARLAEGASKSGFGLVYPVQINEVFLWLDRAEANRLWADGFVFHPRGGEEDGPSAYRFVTSFATEEQDVDQLVAALRRLRV